MPPDHGRGTTRVRVRETLKMVWAGPWDGPSVRQMNWQKMMLSFSVIGAVSMNIARTAGIAGIGAAAVLTAAAMTPANAQELSEKSVISFMEYAWSLVPQQFSKQDGTVIIIDKKKKEEVLVPVDVAREVIKVGRVSAHAQVCGLSEQQIYNHRSMMKREEEKKKWTDQQMVYINQLHLTTVMLLTGKIKLVEDQGGKQVVIEEGKTSTTTCTDEQRTKVNEMITAYVKSGPNFQIKNPAEPPAGAAGNGGQPVATGSTGSPAPAAADDKAGGAKAVPAAVEKTEKQ
jgi:hypothetical protein